MSYIALKPEYKTAGKSTEYNKRGELVQVEYFYVSWKPLGKPGELVKDMAEAKRLYGGRPVLEEVR